MVVKCALQVGHALQRRAVEHIDLAAAGAQKAHLTHPLQLPADDLARGAEVVGDLLVGDARKAVLGVGIGLFEHDAGDAAAQRMEKIILYVGYIEKKNKSIDMLLQVITTINLEEWRLVLIGRVMDDMKEFINNLFENKPELKDKIILKGYISDKNLLSQEYAKSSIYCCTSKKESFGISTLEAAYHGNYIISTNVGGSPDIINKTSYGKIINHDTNDLKETLEYTINNWNKLKRNPSEIQKIVYDNFNWNDLCDKLVKKF